MKERTNPMSDFWGLQEVLINQGAALKKASMHEKGGHYIVKAS